MKQMLIVLPKDLHIAFKALCTQKNLTMRQVIIELINEWMKKAITPD